MAGFIDFPVLFYSGGLRQGWVMPGSIITVMDGNTIHPNLLVISNAIWSGTPFSRYYGTDEWFHAVMILTEESYSEILTDSLLGRYGRARTIINSVRPIGLYNLIPIQFVKFVINCDKIGFFARMLASRYSGDTKAQREKMNKN